MRHNLKTWPEYFQAVLSGEKTFEIRRNDREFETGDLLVLQEYDPDTEEYSGRYLNVAVTSILRGEEWGIKPGYCIMSIRGR